MKKTADRVYRNAKIYSVALDGVETHAQALAIKDGSHTLETKQAFQSGLVMQRKSLIVTGRVLSPDLGTRICILPMPRKNLEHAASATLFRIPRRTLPKVC